MPTGQPAVNATAHRRRNGASISPDDSVAAMLKLIDRLAPSDTGRFLDRHGKQMPW